jgi:SAM-dependent methyltransferase
VSAGVAQLITPANEKFTQAVAQRMITVSQELLSPVYEPLAEQIVADYDLADKSAGIGIDLGSGPGNLILELCRHTRLHWINADINPYFFAHFYAEADKQGFAHRVSAIFADAQALPFRDNYADIIVSRGSYNFWEDKQLAFSEIMRVLKPGGVAYIGRGFARDMPVDIARSIRAKQSGIADYDPRAEAKKLQKIFDKLQIETIRIEIPDPPNAEDLHYGIWIELRKPHDNKRKPVGIIKEN